MWRCMWMLDGSAAAGRQGEQQQRGEDDADGGDGVDFGEELAGFRPFAEDVGQLQSDSSVTLMIDSSIIAAAEIIKI